MPLLQAEAERTASRSLKVRRGGPRSAGRHRQLSEPREGGGELLRPGPAPLQPQSGAAGMEGESAGGVQGAVAKPLGLQAGELAAQQQGVGQGEEQLGDQHQLHPDRVHLEIAEGEVVEAHLLGAADPVLAAGAGAMVALELCGHSHAVGEDRLEAVAVGIGEGELGAGVGALAADEQARALRPGGEVDQVGGLCDLAVVAL